MKFGAGRRRIPQIVPTPGSMKTFSPPGGAFSVQLPDTWTTEWDYHRETDGTGKLLRARAPGADAELMIAPVWTSQPWTFHGSRPATWDDLLQIEQASTRSGHVLREGRWGDFTGIVKWKGSENEIRSWLLHADETVLNVVYHCDAAVAGRDRALIDELLSTLTMGRRRHW